MSSDNENNDVISEDVQQNKIFSVTYQYYGTNNKQEIPDGTEVGWSTQIPNKTYLWIRTVKRYNNGTTTVSNPSPDRNSQYPIDQSSTTVPSDLSRPTPNPVITDEVDDVIGLQVEDLQNQDVSNLISEGQSDNYLQNEAFLSQTEVFNALTDNGQAQGLYRAKDENGKDQIYLNMTYARSGILQVGGSNNELGAFQVLDKDNQIIGYWDKNGIVLTEGEIKSADNSSSWNLKTGELVLNGYVMSYQVEYAIGDSKSTAPQTGWSQNAPAEVEDGKYLWQKSTLVRTGQPTRVTTVCLGKNGIDGINGRGISSAAVEYCISSSVTDPSGDGVWSEAAPAYQENKYYWTRTRITYTDGVTEYSDPALDLALTDANRIAADASAIADVAQRAADQAKADAATAKQNAASAVADAATAKQNAASAVADAAQAKEAANQAQIDADAAAASASSAQTSASNAASSASSAQTSASNAATSASSAQASATSAAEDAAAAREDADDAQSSAEAAATSASAAQTSASNAATSASSAQSSAAAAASSAQVAQSKAEASALSAQAAQVRANDAEAAATSAAENATSALDRAREAAASADSAQTAADNAATSAGDAATSASNAQTAAGNAATSASNAAADAATANQNAAAAVEDARTAKENAAAAKTDAATAKSNAEQAQRDATAANNAATGAVTSLGIVQGVVETLETDVDDLQTHVAMMDAITDEDDNVLVPSGLHVVSTENGYFIVLSNDGMYVYDPQSVLVATYGESISFNSARPQKVGGQDAYLEYYDSNNDGKADALRIVGNKVDITGGAKIYSNNYQASSNPTSPYSASGTFLDLTNGNLYMPNFGVDNVNGQAYINGEIIATGGKLGIDGSQNYWEIDTTKTDYNSNNFASIVGHGNAFIQVGQFQLSDNLFDTRSYDVQAKITYPKYDNTYWDFGIQAPTLNTAASGYVQGIDDNFLYIRNHANTIPSLKQDWNYVFRIDDNGNIYTTGQIYIDGHSLDEIYASQGSGSAYIAKNPVGTWDNTISGNLKVTGSIDGTATKATQLTHWISINGTQWDGSSNLTLGTLNVQYGGTGATTFTAGAALIGNGTGAIQTRTITNNTSSTYVLGSTNLITANTVKYFNGAYDSAHNSNLEYVKHGKLGDVVTHDIDEFITVNGGIIDGSLQVTDLTAGNLVVTGVGRFTNGIYGDLTGNASTANKVNHDLVIQLNGGTTEGTNKFTFNGSAAKTINVTPSAIGLGNVNNTADSAKNVLTATKFSSARTIALTGDVTGSTSADGLNGWSIATTVKDNSHNHTFDNLKPLIKKTYASTSYYATSANSWETSTWYFMSVKPDGWYKPWTVRFKVHTFLPTHENIESISYCTISGRADLLIYSFWNESYYSAHYYIGYYALKQAGFNAGLGHAIGISILYGTSYTDALYYRTFEIEYYECENCSVTILDTPVKWANWSGTGTTNYNGIGSMNMASRGLQESGDSDTLEDRLPYFAVKTGAKGIWGSSLFMRTGTGTYENICTASDGTVTSSNRTTATTKIANTTGFAVGSEVFYSNTSYNANTNINGYGVVYNTVSAFDSRYAINSTLTNNFLTPYEPIYLVGTIGSDGLFYLDPVWWTQTTNVTGKIYILVGGVYDSNTSNCRISLYQHNPWYYYDGSKLVEYVSKATAADTADHLTTARSFTVGKTAKNVDWSSAVSFSKAEISDNASGSAAGWMSSAHYTKLEGIEAGAQVNTITGVKGNSESNYRTGNVNITAANIGLGNLTNDKQVKGLASGTTAGHFVTWGANGYTVADSGYTAGQVVKTLASNNDGKIVLTYLDGTTSDPIEVKIIGSSGSSVSYADALNVNGTTVGSATQPVFINAQGKPQTANSIPKLNNGTTGGAFYAPTAAGTSGQFLVSSGSGAPTWTTITRVTGVKGNAESSYRTGNVNLTPANIGALPLSGGTLTGALILPGNYYYGVNTPYALHLNNSDIVGINGMYFSDMSDQGSEGINFYRDSTHWDSLHAGNGVLYFTPNRQNGSSGEQQIVYTIPNYGRGTTDLSIRPLVHSTRANRLAFLPADQVIIEKTIDGGVTWVDAGYSDAVKIGLFNNLQSTIQIPLLNSAKSTQCGLRVTLTGMKYDVPEGTAETAKYNYWNADHIIRQERYFNVREWWFWLSSNNDSIRVQIEAATGAASTTWRNMFDADFGMNGWSGSDWIRAGNGNTFGGGTTQTGNYWNWRLTFWSKYADGKTEFNSANIQNINTIYCYGDNVWGKPNNLMANDHLYSWDNIQNAIFPANVTATKFIGPLQGNADTATKFNSNRTIALTGDTTGSASGDGNSGWSIATINSRLSYYDQLTSLEAIDTFGTDDSKFKIARVSSLNGHAGDLTRNDGIIMNIPWSHIWGHQLFFDDSGYQIAHRYNSNGTWAEWKNLLDTNNYTNYTVTKTGSGASGTWGINVTGSAGSVAWGNITSKPIIFKNHASSLASEGWKTLNGRTGGAIISIAYNNNPANWNSGTYSSSFVFGCSDTRGLLDINYNSPIITFGGGSVGNSTDDNPYWYFKMKGTTEKTYTFPTSDATLVSTTGTGATGTWDISISGNAATATKATQDGSGNTITSHYCTLSTAQTLSGAKTFSAATSFTNTTASTSKTTGAVKVSGGLGVAGAVHGQSLHVNDKVNLVWNDSTQSLDFQFAS